MKSIILTTLYIFIGLMIHSKNQTPSKAIDIQITITAGVSTKGTKSGVVVAHTEKIAVTPNMTAQWKEWNITNAMLDCWQNKTNNTLLELTMHFKLLKSIRGQRRYQS